LLFGGCFSKRSREIAALLPKPARFENEWLRIERHEPSLHYLRYLQFELDFKNLTDRALELKINCTKLVAPTNQSYSIFDEENALALAAMGGDLLPYPSRPVKRFTQIRKISSGNIS
jgi:hypothetical protein